MRLTNKGFLLIDSLITVFITSLVCVLCYAIYQTNINYEDGYMQYQSQSNQNLEEILIHLNQCDKCEVLDESD